MRSNRARGAPRSAPSGSLRGAALRLLGRRDYTVAELRERLLTRGHDTGEIDAELDRLAGEGLADDRRAAIAHIRTGSRVKGRGKRRIRHELEARGVAPALIDELLASRGDDEELEAVARVIARKRLPARLPMPERQRLFQQLLRRGFAADVIARALKGREHAE